MASYNITLKDPEGVEIGTFECDDDKYILEAEEEAGFDNINYSCRAGACSSCAGKLLSGDVNYDGVVNILDVVGLINIVLGEEDENSAGDLNSDGVYDVLDIVQLVNIILNEF